MAATLAPTQPQSNGNRLHALLDELLLERTPAGEPALPAAGRIASNLLETWGAYWVQLCLPAVDPESLQVQVVARQLTVSGKYHVPKIETATALREEIATGEVFEEVMLPGEVDGDKAEAHYDRGILTVRMPKVAYLKPASIKVQVP
jgi:HSP20 family protein